MFVDKLLFLNIKLNKQNQYTKKQKDLTILKFVTSSTLNNLKTID